jgi:hypothetical protein
MKAVTIAVVNYQTPDLTRLCLRSLHKFTNLERVRVVVIDNNSKDDSIDYLRNLDWIELVERPSVPGETPPESHSRALDIGLGKADTPYFFVMHTDTLMVHDGWLDYLIGEIEKNDRIAGVGSWKMEIESPIKTIGQKIETFVREKILQRKSRRHRSQYLRSHGALYRTALLKEHTSGFCDGDTAGKSAHFRLTDAGFTMRFLPVRILNRYMRHLNHATMILNPEISGRNTGTPKARKRIQEELNNIGFKEILNDDKLDKI